MGEVDAIMYMIPLDDVLCIADPLRVYSRSAVHSEGTRTFIARRRSVGYSPKDADADSVYALKANPDATGNPRE